MRVKNNRLSFSSQRGSILVYAVLVIVFFSALAVFFRASSTPVFSHASDTRRQYEVTYLLDSVNHILNEHLLYKDVDFTNNIEVANCLSEMKTFVMKSPSQSEDEATVVTRMNSGIKSESIIFVTDSNNQVSQIKVENLEFKIKFADGTALSRTRTLRLYVK